MDTRGSAPGHVRLWMRNTARGKNTGDQEIQERLGIVKQTKYLLIS